MLNKPITVAVAILYKEGRFLMQLRDEYKKLESYALEIGIVIDVVGGRSQQRILVSLSGVCHIPGIVYPGHWGLFGGHLERGETPHLALQRELLEEIGYTTNQSVKFRVYRRCWHYSPCFFCPPNGCS